MESLTTDGTYLGPAQERVLKAIKRRELQLALDLALTDLTICEREGLTHARQAIAKRALGLVEKLLPLGEMVA
jgi:hypothetical protein